LASFSYLRFAFKKIARQFAHNIHAATAIEFAMLVPVWLWMTFETCQIGLYLFYSATLVRVTDAASRQIVTGSVASQGLTGDQFRTQILCPLLPGFMSCSSVVTNIQTVPNTANAFYAFTDGSPSIEPTGLKSIPMDNTKTTFCVGQKGSLIAVQVFYAMPVLGMAPLGLSNTVVVNGQHVIWISATTAFENEPFNTSNAAC
jgi:Flp pilus assembly protein TadG